MFLCFSFVSKTERKLEVRLFATNKKLVKKFYYMFRNLMLSVKNMPEELEDFIRNDETIKKHMKILEAKIKYEVIKISSVSPTVKE